MTARFFLVWTCALLFMARAGAAPAPSESDTASVSVHPELEDVQTEIIRSFYYIASSRSDYAIDMAVRALQVDPTLIGAHRVYIYGLLEQHQSAQILRIYQDWYAQKPEDPVRSTALVWAWMARQDDPGPWCDEVDSLTQEIPEDDSAAYWSHRARFEASKDCFFDGSPSRTALIELGKQHEEAWGYRLRLILAADDEIPDELAAEVLSFAKAHPNRLAYLPNLWASRLKGATLVSLREDMIELARTAALSEDEVELYEAAMVLGRADLDEEEAAAMARLESIDPGRLDRKIIQRAGERSFFNQKISDRPSPDELRVAALIKTHERRELLRALRTVDAELPATGRARADWHTARAGAEASLGRIDESIESLRLAWESEPRGSSRKGVAANRYAWTAAVHQRDLEQALTAIDDALAHLPSWDSTDPDFQASSYDDWLENQRRRTAAWLDTRGWILFRLNQLDESISSLQEAVLMSPHPNDEIIIHLGLVHGAAGHDAEALRLISRGLSLQDEPTPLALDARESAEGLFANYRWTGTGLDGWIAAHAPSVQGPHESTELPDYRIGKSFPDLEIQINGKEGRLSDYDGILVVDLWASWCGPCVSALPHMNEVADQYGPRGVTVVGISVDREFSDARKVLRKADVMYPSTWGGPEAMQSAHVRSIPAVFILDDDLTVLAFVPGYREGDTRIDQELDTILGARSQE